MGRKNRAKKQSEGIVSRPSVDIIPRGDGEPNSKKNRVDSDRPPMPQSSVGQQTKQPSLNHRDLAVPERKMNENPLLHEQQEFLETLQSTERDCFFSESLVTPERRAEVWMNQADLGVSLVDRFAWATPDARAVKILAHFAPLVEIGCGANAYWCRVLSRAGVDILGYDLNTQSGGKISASSSRPPVPRSKDSSRDLTNQVRVHHGGPEVLSFPENANRNLFLCYPDEDPAASVTVEVDDDDAEKENDDDDDDAGDTEMTVGHACLHYFTGDYVIHVGELYGDTLGMQQAPWGRSSSPDFQQQLASDFHCLLNVSIPNWVHVRDTLSVWKRSEQCTMVFAADDGEDDDDEEEEIQYRHIPPEERLPTDVAAPCVAHLLQLHPTSISVSNMDNSAKKRTTSVDKYLSFKKKKPLENGSKMDLVSPALDSVAADSKEYSCPW